MSDFTSQSNVLNLAPKANTTKSVKTNSQKADSNNQAELSNTGENNQTESFLANLIQAIDETNEFLPERLQISEKEIVQEFMFKIEKGNLFGDFADEQKTSIFESLSFMQVLGVLENLQVQNTDIKLANLSSQMQQFLQTQNNLDALKDAKSLNELLNIAKSLNLEVSNIKIDRLADLKSTFPNLNKANFFANTIESVFKDFLNNKIAHIIKESGVSKENATNSKGKTTSKDNSTLLSKTLQSITSKVNEDRKSVV